MSPRKQTRLAPGVLTARTGEDIYGLEESVASDATSQSNSETTAAPMIVGRTPYDLLHEWRVLAAVARLISGMDAVELLASVAYIVLGLWGKSAGSVMRFWVFLTLLSGYHVILKPLGSLLWVLVGRPRRPPVSPGSSSGPLSSR